MQYLLKLKIIMQTLSPGKGHHLDFNHHSESYLLKTELPGSHEFSPCKYLFNLFTPH